MIVGGENRPFFVVFFNKCGIIIMYLQRRT
nr:MAG TPA: hypothetical protein [Herelleviridae sp.]